MVKNVKIVACSDIHGQTLVPIMNEVLHYKPDIEEELAKHFEKIPPGIDILISHSPPLGEGENENFDVSMQFKPEYRRHFGSKYLRRRIIETMPHLVICGHIHSGEHKLHQFNSTTAIANVSLLDEHYTRAYGMAKMTMLPGRKLRFTKGRNLYA